MSLVLYAIGAAVFIISIIVGLMQGSFWGAIMSLGGGISSAVIFFALGKILDNQENILLKLAAQEEINKKHFKLPQVECPKCSYKHDDDYTSCPHCGYRY
jgi:uncharacterized membrane protein YdjX (TVP38/TMEM64 family)